VSLGKQISLYVFGNQHKTDLLLLITINSSFAYFVRNNYTGNLFYLLVCSYYGLGKARGVEKRRNERAKKKQAKC